MVGSMVGTTHGTMVANNKGIAWSPEYLYVIHPIIQRNTDPIMSKLITLRITDELYQRLRAQAQRQSCSISDVIRGRLGDSQRGPQDREQQLEDLLTRVESLENWRTEMEERMYG